MYVPRRRNNYRMRIYVRVIFSAAGAVVVVGMLVIAGDNEGELDLWHLHGGQYGSFAARRCAGAYCGHRLMLIAIVLIACNCSEWVGERSYVYLYILYWEYLQRFFFSIIKKELIYNIVFNSTNIYHVWLISWYLIFDKQKPGRQ